MDQIPGGLENQLREVIAHLGTALTQSDFTDDQIITGHIRSAHALALDILRADRCDARSATTKPRRTPSIVPNGDDQNI